MRITRALGLRWRISETPSARTLQRQQVRARQHEHAPGRTVEQARARAARHVCSELAGKRGKHDFNNDFDPAPPVRFIALVATMPRFPASTPRGASLGGQNQWKLQIVALATLQELDDCLTSQPGQRYPVLVGESRQLRVFTVLQIDGRAILGCHWIPCDRYGRTLQQTAPACYRIRVTSSSAKLLSGNDLRGDPERFSDRSRLASRNRFRVTCATLRRVFAPVPNSWSAGCTGTIAFRQATSRIGRVSGSGRARPDSSSSVSTSSMTVQSSS